MLDEMGHRVALLILRNAIRLEVTMSRGIVTRGCVKPYLCRRSVVSTLARVTRQAFHPRVGSSSRKLDVTVTMLPLT